MTTCLSGPCSSKKYFVGDVGTEIIVDVCVDITAALAQKLFVLKPGAAVPEEWVGGVYRSRYIRYVVVAGNFDVAGDYRVHGWVQLPTGEWTGDEDQFTVYDRFS